MPTVQDFLHILRQLTPEDLAEDWDNVGLLVGSPRQQIKNILLALDPTEALIEEAITSGANLILTHHPVIFRPLKALRTDSPIGSLLQKALIHQISIIACHTNFDAIADGVSDVLAQKLGLQDPKPLLISKHNSCCGLGRLGAYDTTITSDEFLARLKQACNPPWVLEAGPRPATVQTVAVCGGSCSDFAELSLNLGADVFVTAEIKHATACWARESGLWLLDAGHFATEYPAMEVLQGLLLQLCQEESWNVQIQTARQQSPLKLVQ